MDRQSCFVICPSCHWRQRLPLRSAIISLHSNAMFLPYKGRSVHCHVTCNFNELTKSFLDSHCIVVLFLFFFFFFTQPKRPLTSFLFVAVVKFTVLLVTRHDHPIWKNVGKKQIQHFYRELQVCF